MSLAKRLAAASLNATSGAGSGGNQEKDKSTIENDDDKSSSSSSSLKSIRVLRQEVDIGLVSHETKYRAMLGFKDYAPGTNPFECREDFCGACGIQHPCYQLLDLYNTCLNCLNCLREHCVLRNRCSGIPQDNPLEILVASYGDIIDPTKAVDVTAIVKGLVNEYIGKDRLMFRETQNFSKIFNCDPVPGKPKQLRIRYRMNMKHGFITIDVMANNMIPEPILLLCPSNRLLTIVRASYGHPKGRTTTGRMSVDVAENVQGLVDLNFGSYIYISAMAPINRLFGDPCPGYLKDLQVEYDISGKSGYIEVGEIRGQLKKDILIDMAPCISPLIFVSSATYGISPTAIIGRVQELKKKVARIEVLEHRRSIGMLISAEDRAMIKTKDNLKKEIDEVKSAEPVSFDVTVKLQRLVDKQGGFELLLDKANFFPNLLFGNPCKGRLKYLEVALHCYGHDSESRTTNKEVTSKGYLKNYILGKKERYLIPVHDGPTNEGIMESSLHFDTNNVLPLVHINKATYGHPRDNSKTFDVTNEVQNLVCGKILSIKKEAEINKLFGDPCPGVNKVLKINYATRGFTGAVRVREKDNCLVAAVELGFPNTPPPDS